jgi:poly(hydroxyalkanoate) depolymerase family esterase
MLNTMFAAWPAFGLSVWGEAPTPKSGQFIPGLFHADFKSLRYKLFIPSGYSGAPLPLIVMLHGCGQDAADFALGTGMNELAEECRCLVLYPEQSSDANWNRCWNWFEGAHHERGRGEPALIAGATRKIMAEYAVDARRVSVAGLSCGGAMAVILGRTYPDIYTSVGCHSGLAHGSATDGYGAMLAMRDGADLSALSGATAASAVPVIVFHGDADGTVHHKNSMAVVQQSIDSHLAHFPQEELSVSEETGEARGRGFTRSIHRAKGGEIVAEQWTVHGAAHAWSGGKRHGSYTDTGGPSASEKMLEFFLRR